VAQSGARGGRTIAGRKTVALALTSFSTVLLLVPGFLAGCVQTTTQSAAPRSPPAAPTRPATLAEQVRLGDSMWRAGDIPGALGFYQDASRQDARDPVALRRMGQALAEIGEPKRAEQAFLATLMVDSSDAVAWRGLGLAQLRLQRPDKAAASLQPLADTSADPQLLCLYGTALAMSGRPDEAASAYRRGLVLAPANAALHGNLALALAAAGRTGEAMTEMEAAVAAPIPDPRQDANAVLVLALLGRDSEARTRAQDAKIGLLATEMLMDRAAQARQEPDAAGRSRALGLAAALGPGLVKAGPEAP